jgi:hypothetical protein
MRQAASRTAACLLFVDAVGGGRWIGCFERYSEGGVGNEAMMVFQLQLTKRQDVVPMTRDYIAREEARLRALEGGGRPPLRPAGE